MVRRSTLGDWDSKTAPLHHRSLQHGQHGRGLYQRDQLHHPLRAADGQWAAHRQPSLRRDHQLPAAAADPHSLSHERRYASKAPASGNLALNGDVRYTISNSDLPNYYENFQGLDGAIRSATFTGNTDHAQRRMVSHRLRHDVAGKQGVRFGSTRPASPTCTSRATPTSPPVHYAEHARPRPATRPSTTPARWSREAPPLPSRAIPATAPLYAYFGQKYITNNATDNLGALLAVDVLLDLPVPDAHYRSDQRYRAVGQRDRHR